MHRRRPAATGAKATVHGARRKELKLITRLNFRALSR